MHFPEIFFLCSIMMLHRPVEPPGYYSYINVPVYAFVAEQAAVDAGVALHYHEFVAEVKPDGDDWLVSSYARGIKRITIAGRILSSDRKSLAGIRAQCTCMAMGQAMGAAGCHEVFKGA